HAPPWLDADGTMHAVGLVVDEDDPERDELVLREIAVDVASGALLAQRDVERVDRFDTTLLDAVPIEDGRGFGALLRRSPGEQLVIAHASGAVADPVLEWDHRNGRTHWASLALDEGAFLVHRMYGGGDWSLEVWLEMQRVATDGREI